MTKYNIYATLLDAFQGYLSSSDVYQQYWGFAESPSKTEDEFEEEQFQGLIDRINRVPFESEAADKGTAFNELIDSMVHTKQFITNGKPINPKMEVLRSNKEKGVFEVKYNGREFEFPLNPTVEFSKRFKGSFCQVMTEAILPTKYGDVCLYGYIDELMPMSVHDIKTTSKYSAGKFRKHWQKIVYPYCLNANGNNVKDFEYNIVLFKDKSNNFETFTEYYAYVPERDNKLLTEHVESLIEFLESNRGKITDLKIFNQHEKEM
jgi:hypothetical protein